MTPQERLWRSEMLRIRGFWASRAAPGGPFTIRGVQHDRALRGGYHRRVIESIGGIDVNTQTDEELFHLLTDESEASSSANAVENAVPVYRTIVFRPTIVSPARLAANAVSHARTQGDNPLITRTTCQPINSDPRLVVNPWSKWRLHV